MTQAAYFPSAYKNALLGVLTGQAATMAASNIGVLTSASGYFTMYSSPYGDTSAPLCGATAHPMSGAHIGSAIGGTANWQMTFTPNANGTAVWARMGVYHASGTKNVDGLVTDLAGDGMVQLANTTVVSGTAIQAYATLKCPLNNSGTLNINTITANSILNSMLWDSNAPKMSDGVLSFYDGVQPATADTPLAAQTLLCNTYPLATTSWATPAAGSIRLATPCYPTTATVAAGNGTATWFRWVNGALVIDGSVNTAGAAVDLLLSDNRFGTAAPEQNNYATYDPNSKASQYILTGGNLIATLPSEAGAIRNIATDQYEDTVPRYCEVLFSGTIFFGYGVLGIAQSTDWVASGMLVGEVGNFGYGYGNNGVKRHNSSGAAYGSAWVAGDRLSMLWNPVTGELIFWKNGISLGVAYSGIVGAYRPMLSMYNSSGSNVVATINLGASAFFYAASVPVGYLGWYAYGRKMPTIQDFTLTIP